MPQWALHTRNCRPVDKLVILALNESRTLHSALEIQQQAIYAMLDQEYHRNGPSSFCNIDHNASFRALHDKFASPLVWQDGTHWQCTFSHMINYGASYYSYLYSQVIAAHIWTKYFMHDPLSRSTGCKLKNGLLAHGGARTPHSLLAELLPTRNSHCKTTR